MGRVVNLADVARHHRNSRLDREFLALDLVTHRLNGMRIWTDEDNLLFSTTPGESRAFRQEAKARVDRLGAGFAHRCDDLVGDQIALRGRWRPDEDGFVGHLDGHGIGVGFGIDDHRLDPHLSTGLDDPDGDLAPVGDEDF